MAGPRRYRISIKDLRPAKPVKAIPVNDGEGVEGSSHIWYIQLGESVVITEYADDVITCFVDRRK
jgi:hypothetical protein